MKFLDRLTSGLISPKRILSFSEDKFILAFFVLLFEIIVLAIPGIISAYINNPLTYDTKVNIRESFYLEDVPYEIKNGSLNYIGTGTEKDYYIVYTDEYTFVFSRNDNVRSLLYSNNNNGSIIMDNNASHEVIIFNSDSIYINLYTVNFKLGNYDEFNDFEGLSFLDNTPNDDNFWDPFFTGFKKVFEKYQDMVFVINVIITILSEIVTFLLMILIITAISRMGKVGLVSFGKSFKLIIYFMMPYVLGEFIATLTGVRILMYIGMGYTLVNIFRMNFMIGGSNNE